jgi:uncharacterized protein YdcH (DUF465 family)
VCSTIKKISIMNKYISLALTVFCVTFSACNTPKTETQSTNPTTPVVSTTTTPIIPTAQNLHTLDTATIKSIAPDSIWSFSLTPAQIASLLPAQKNALRYAIAGAMANIVYTEITKSEETGELPDLTAIGMKQDIIYESYPDVFTFDQINALGSAAEDIVKAKGAEARQDIALNRAKNDSLDDVIAQAEKNIAQTEQETEELRQRRKKAEMQNAILDAINASVSQNAIASN